MMIDLIFALLNFILLVVVCVRLFRRYAFEALRGYITMEQVHVGNMQRRHEQLVKQEQLLAKAGQRQHDIYHDLSRNIATWNAVLHKKDLAAKDCLLRIHKDNLLRMNEQERYIKEQIMRKEVLPQALSNAMHTLQKKFEDARLQKKYIDDAIQKMSEGKG